MNPWQPFLSAFCGTAAALLLAAIFGKTLLKIWFRKDFKRLEAKIDELTHIQEFKFEQRQQLQASKMTEIVDKSKDIEAELQEYVMHRVASTLATGEDVVSEKLAAIRIAEKIHKQHAELLDLGALSRPYFSEATNGLFKDLITAMDKAIAEVESANFYPSREELGQIKTLAAVYDAIMAIEQEFKTIIASDEPWPDAPASL